MSSLYFACVSMAYQILYMNGTVVPNLFCLTYPHGPSVDEMAFMELFDCNSGWENTGAVADLRLHMWIRTRQSGPGLFCEAQPFTIHLLLLANQF